VQKGTKQLQVHLKEGFGCVAAADHVCGVPWSGPVLWRVPFRGHATSVLELALVALVHCSSASEQSSAHSLCTSGTRLLLTRHQKYARSTHVAHKLQATHEKPVNLTLLVLLRRPSATKPRRVALRKCWRKPLLPSAAWSASCLR
jgi:hypothetical protein